MIPKISTEQRRVLDEPNGEPIVVEDPERGVDIAEDDRGRLQLRLRSRLEMNRESFARLIPISVRHLASIEGGQQPTENILRRLTELRRLNDGLSEIIRQEAVDYSLQGCTTLKLSDWPDFSGHRSSYSLIFR